MFRKGHKLFSIASIGLIIVAVLQAVLYFSVWVDELAISGVGAFMQAYRFDFGPGDPTVMDSHESLSLALAVMLLWTGLLNLLVARYTAIRDKLMRRSCTLSLIMVVMLLVLFSIYQMMLPVIGLSVVGVLFFVARFRLRRSRRVGGAADNAYRGPDSFSPVLEMAPVLPTVPPVAPATPIEPINVELPAGQVEPARAVPDQPT